ncbi:MAG: class I SAM-dependent methyltransferase [Candidatus Micrarchaeota archaeon]
MKVKELVKRCFLTCDQKSYAQFMRRLKLLEKEPALTATDGAIKFSGWLNSLIGKRLGVLIASKLTDRSDKIARQISPYIPSWSNVLDFGCGDGIVGQKISGFARVSLADVVNYNRTNLPFSLFDGKSLSLKDESFDRVLLLTVLHHAKDPLATLREATRVCKIGGKLIVIESIYFNQPHKIFNRFADWLYNNVFNDPRIPVPWNFMTAGGWEILFKEFGLKTVEMVHLGIDQPIVPEWHVLFVLEKTS